MLCDTSRARCRHAAHGWRYAVAMRYLLPRYRYLTLHAGVRCTDTCFTHYRVALVFTLTVGAVMRIEEKRHTSTESQTTLGRWCSAGSVVSAFAMGICCIGPLIFAALGLSSFASLWVLRHLTPYRHLFLLLTVVFLGLGFYTTYRQGKTVRMLDKGILWASTLLVLALLGYSFSVEGFVLF